MAKNMGKGPSGHGQLTKISLSEGYGGKTITTAAQFGYDHHGFKGYLGNVGLAVFRISVTAVQLLGCRKSPVI